MMSAIPSKSDTRIDTGRLEEEIEEQIRDRKPTRNSSCGLNDAVAAAYDEKRGGVMSLRALSRFAAYGITISTCLPPSVPEEYRRWRRG